MTPTPQSARFEALFATTERDLLAYAVRRVPQREDAADIVAETFLTAWRRLDDVPSGAEARLWLYGVARRHLANHVRGEHRRHGLAARLRQELAALPPVPATTDDPRLAVLHAAMATLSVDDREVLRLASWEELTPSEIAVVLGITGVGARTRLHRARKRLATAIAEAAVATTQSPELLTYAEVQR